MNKVLLQSKHQTRNSKLETFFTYAFFRAITFSEASTIALAFNP